MTINLKKGFRIGEWEVRPLEGSISGPAVVRVTPKTMDVLLCLAEDAGHVVERDDLVKKVWGERAVSDEPLTRCIGELRQAFGDSRSAPDYIQTVPKRGYRLLAKVEIEGAEEQTGTTIRLPTMGQIWHERSVPSKIGVVAVAAAAIVLAYLGLSEPEPRAGTDTAGDMQPAVAVLPFENLSGNPDEEHLSDGLADMLTHVLARIDGLTVIARTSAFAFKGKNEDVRLIGEKLGVHALLEGSVQRDGDMLRITTQLVDTKAGGHIWSESFDRPVDNFFAVQDEVAAAVASALRVAMAGQQVQSAIAGTRSFEAYDAYLLGRQLLNRRTSDSLAEAVGHFRRAIDLDPDYALAYIGLADTYILLNWYANVPRAEMAAHAEPAIARALEIDPVLGEAYATQGWLHFKFDRFEAAEEALQRAIALNPNYAPSYFIYGTIYNDSGRSRDALRMHKAARDLDPLSPVINTAIAVAHEKLGEFDEALAQYQELLEIFPEYAAVKDRLAGLQWSKLARLDVAIRLQLDAVDVDPTYSSSPTELALLLMDLGLATPAKQWVDYGLRVGGGVAWSLQVQCILHVYNRNDAAVILESALEASKEMTTAQGLDAVVRIARDVYIELGEYENAIALYESHFPELFGAADVPVIFNNFDATIDLAALLDVTGRTVDAKRLLDAAEAFMQTQPRLGYFGYGIGDVEIHAIRGDTERALAALEAAVADGWRMSWWWETERNPNLAAINGAPRYAAIIAGLRDEMNATAMRVADWPDLLPPN